MEESASWPLPTLIYLFSYFRKIYFSSAKFIVHSPNFGPHPPPSSVCVCACVLFYCLLWFLSEWDFLFRWLLLSCPWRHYFIIRSLLLLFIIRLLDYLLLYYYFIIIIFYCGTRVYFWGCRWREIYRERWGGGRSNRYLPTYSIKHIEGLGVGFFYNNIFYFFSS